MGQSAYDDEFSGSPGTEEERQQHNEVIKVKTLYGQLCEIEKQRTSTLHTSVLNLTEIKSQYNVILELVIDVMNRYIHLMREHRLNPTVERILNLKLIFLREKMNENYNAQRIYNRAYNLVSGAASVINEPFYISMFKEFHYFESKDGGPEIVELEFRSKTTMNDWLVKGAASFLKREFVTILNERPRPWMIEASESTYLEEFQRRIKFHAKRAVVQIKFF